MARPPRKSSCAFPPEDISRWDNRRVLSWLRQNGLHDAIEPLSRSKTDGRALLAMSEFDFQSRRDMKDKDKKKIIKALARLPDSQIGRTPGRMTRFADKLKKKFSSGEGGDRAPPPPPPPEADYLAMDEINYDGGDGGSWGSDFDSEEEDYDEPPDDVEPPPNPRGNSKIKLIQEQFKRAGIGVPTPYQPPQPSHPPPDFDDDGDDIYDAPEPDVAHSGITEEDMYIEAGATVDEMETYEIPEVESAPVIQKPWQRKAPQHLPPMQRLQQRPPPPPGRPRLPEKPLSPTGPPPDFDYAYDDEDTIYDDPANDEEVEEQRNEMERRHQPPLPRVFQRPNLANRSKASLPEPFTAPPRPLSPKPAPPRSGVQRPQPPPLPPAAADEYDDDDGNDGPPVVGGRPPLPSPGTRPSLPGRDTRPPPSLPNRDTKPTLPNRGGGVGGGGAPKPSLPNRGNPAPPRPPKDTKPAVPGMAAAGSRPFPPKPAMVSPPPPRPTSKRPSLDLEPEEASLADFASGGRKQQPPPLPPSMSKPVLPPMPREQPKPPHSDPFRSGPGPRAPKQLPPAPVESRPPMMPAPKVKEKRIEDCVWYGANADRKACEIVLNRCSMNGCFIVRNSTRYQGEYSLSLYFNGETKHLRIRRRDDGQFAVGNEKKDEKAFQNVIELVEFHQKEPLQLLSGVQTLLTRPCSTR